MDMDMDMYLCICLWICIYMCVCIYIYIGHFRRILMKISGSGILRMGIWWGNDDNLMGILE